MKAKICIYSALLLLASVSGLWGDSQITAAAVQLNIDPSIYSSRDTFYTHISQIVEEAVEDYSPDLIVFPEYTGVFTAAFGYDLSVLEDSSRRSTPLDDPGTVLRVLDPRIRSPEEFFISNDTSAVLDDVFGTLARKHRIYILAGTTFVPYETVEGIALRNRACVYGPDGSLHYTQDKVFLTPFESDLLDISPGRVEEARPFLIGGTPVALTICRDTFFSVWEEHFSGVSLWIDIKANGTEYTPDQEQLFEQALPARIAASDVPAGLTVCLTGDFFGFLWEGPSSIAVPAGEGEFFLTETVPHPDAGALLVLSLKKESEIAAIYIAN